MQLQIITPEKTTFDGEIDELIIPTVTGELAILPHHADLLSRVEPGEITIKQKGKEFHLAVTGGFLQVTTGDITVLADYAVKSEEIDAKKALEAQQRAEAILKKKDESISERDYAIAQADMRRAILELKVSRKYRKNSTTMS